MSSLTKKGVLPTSNTVINTLTNNNGQDASLLAPYLVILSGCDRGKHFKLEQSRTVFGRSDEADIVIADPKISRRHGALNLSPEGICFEDLKSTNGTFLAGERIDIKWLNMYDRLLAGDTVMRIDYKCSNEVASAQALYQAAYTDALTGILNRGAFMQRAYEEFSYSKRNNALLSVVMCDVDYFKAINDNYGHPAGDQILKELSNILAKDMRNGDLLARYGGEEFIVLLREAPMDAAMCWAERVRQAVMKHIFVYRDQVIPITISIGLCCRRIGAIDSLPTIIRVADDALYCAKQNGRNRLEVASFSTFND